MSKKITKDINYVVPPGVQQGAIIQQQYRAQSKNEQSLALRVSGNGLEPEDSTELFFKMY
jgi:hypothetical protein